MSQIQLPEDWRKRIEELAGDGDERAAILKERAETEERLRRLARLYQDLLVDDNEYRRTLDRLQSHLASLVLPDNPKLIEAEKYLEQLGELWAAASFEERRDLMRIMVNSLRVDVLKEQIVGIKPLSAFRVLLEQVCDGVSVTVVT